MSGQDSRKLERTGFQEDNAYGAEYDLRTDFIMVYGIGNSMPERVAAWQKRGYRIHLMTGVSWGEYQAYLNGNIDSREHWDEAQRRQNGEDISHGPTVPYMVPTIAFTDFLTQGIKKAVDSGVDAIHLEEPEFWADAGYSPAFQREWEIYYGEPWAPPHTSPDLQYRASKLKRYLYTRALDRICSAAKEYAKVRYNRNLKFYVPTHSLINYTQWRIVSPESGLIDLPTCDGYIAQIWTGTARTPNVYQGVRKERTFETAFLEYGIMQELVRGTGRRMWFLHDPIEDNPRHTWSDYRGNYFSTVIASLLHPEVSDYEVSPWPRRVFTRAYPTEDGNSKELIPPSYATELLTVMNTLRHLGDYEYAWPETTEGVGILLADSAMYQRAEPAFSNGEATKYDGTDQTVKKQRSEKQQSVLDFSAFYGLALPLVKQGIPVRPVQLDNLTRFPGYLDPYRVLFLSYEFMKPERSDLHLILTQWVQGGGVLIYVGDDSDPFHEVKEWWNQGSRRYQTPRQHLFESLGIGLNPEADLYPVGRGFVRIERTHPAAMAASPDGARSVRTLLREALEARGEHDYVERPFFQLRRGPYLIAAGMDEYTPGDTASQSIELSIPGRFLNLFSSDLQIIDRIDVTPGSRWFVLDLDEIPDEPVRVLASASRIEELEASATHLSFRSETPKGVRTATRIRLPKAPADVRVLGADGNPLAFDTEWDGTSTTLLLTHPGVPEGAQVEIRWK